MRVTLWLVKYITTEDTTSTKEEPLNGRKLKNTSTTINSYFISLKKHINTSLTIGTKGSLIIYLLIRAQYEWIIRNDMPVDSFQFRLIYFPGSLASINYKWWWHSLPESNIISPSEWKAFGKESTHMIEIVIDFQYITQNSLVSSDSGINSYYICN